MPPRKRATFAERQHDAIYDPPTPTPTPTETETPTEEKKRGAAPGKFRVAMSLTTEDFNKLKGACIADWAAGNTTRSLSEWLTDTVEAFIKLPRAEQAQWIPERGTGKRSRYFDIDLDILNKTQKLADKVLTTHCWSRAQILTAAAHYAIHTATQTHGKLPKPPTRMPARRNIS